METVPRLPQKTVTSLRSYCVLALPEPCMEAPTIPLCQSGYLNKGGSDGRDSLVLASPESWLEM